MNTTELRAQMTRCGKNREQLCEAMGISLSTWSRKVNGKSQFTVGEASVLRQELNLDERLIALIFFDEKVS